MANSASQKNDARANSQVADADVQHLMVVDGWSLAVWGEGEEPRVRDVELAERLGIAEPRMIRRLIKSLIKEGEISDVYVRSRRERASMPRGGEREVAVSEYWLTEAQALLVTTQSRTEQAKAVRAEMVRVYMLARRGLLPQQQPANDAVLAKALESVATAITQLGTNLAAINARVTNLETQRQIDVAPSNDGTIGRVAARLICLKLSRYADLMTGEPGNSRLWKSARKSAENELRETLAHSGRRGLYMLPVEKLGHATGKLSDMLRIAELHAKKEGRSIDGTLPLFKKNVN